MGDTPSDEEILLSLLQGNDAQAWGFLRQGWKAGIDLPVCAWEGIRCDPAGDDIIQIDVPSVGIRGTIPSDIGFLSSLQTINFYNNKMVGTIPEAIYALPRLVAFDVGLNLLEGRLHRFQSDNIQVIHVENNNLSGSIPSTIGKWYPYLTSLDLANNRFTGTIPPSLFESATTLVRLSLSHNNFYGTIPTSIGQLTELKGLFLNNNDFYGIIPRQLASEEMKLVQIFLQHNSFSGTIPLDLSEIRALADFYIDGNKMTGTVPMELCAKNLNAGYFASVGSKVTDRDGCESIACPINTFSEEGVWPCSPCPHGFYTPFMGWNGQCIQSSEKAVLDMLYLTTGGQSWTNAARWGNPNVPYCMYEGIDCNGENKIVSITLRNMNLKGTIPPDLGRLAHLRVLDLGDNSLSGTIPSDLRFAPLEHFDVGNNSVMGPLPPLLCQENGINLNGQRGQYSCDYLACPVATWHPVGRAMKTGHRCYPCQYAEFVGQVKCGTKGLSAGEKIAEYMQSHGWSHTFSICIVVSMVSVAVFALCRSEGKRQTEEPQDKQSAEEKYYDEHMYGGSAYKQDYDDAMSQEELGALSARKERTRMVHTGTKQGSGTPGRSRRGSGVTAVRAHLGKQSKQTSSVSSAASQASPGDDPDTQDLWLDVPKIA